MRGWALNKAKKKQKQEKLQFVFLFYLFFSGDEGGCPFVLRELDFKDEKKNKIVLQIFLGPLTNFIIECHLKNNAGAICLQ